MIDPHKFRLQIFVTIRAWERCAVRASFWVPTQSGQPETGEPEGARTTSGLWRAGNTTSARALLTPRTDAPVQHGSTQGVQSERHRRGCEARGRNRRSLPGARDARPGAPTRRFLEHGPARVTCLCSFGAARIAARRRRGGAGDPAHAPSLFQRPRRPGRASRFSSIAPRLLLRLVRPRPHPPESAAPASETSCRFLTLPMRPFAPAAPQSCKRTRLKKFFSPGRACCAECLKVRDPPASAAFARARARAEARHAARHRRHPIRRVSATGPVAHSDVRFRRQSGDATFFPRSRRRRALPIRSPLPSPFRALPLASLTTHV